MLQLLFLLLLQMFADGDGPATLVRLAVVVGGERRRHDDDAVAVVCYVGSSRHVGRRNVLGLEHLLLLLLEVLRVGRLVWRGWIYELGDRLGKLLSNFHFVS